MTDTLIDTSTNADTNTETQTKEENVTDWRSSLAEEYRNHESLQGYDDINKLVKTYLNQEQLVGKKSEIPKLGPDEDPDSWNEFYKKLGRPEKPDQYGLEVAEDSKALLDIFHKAGLSKTQAKKIYESFGSMTEERTQAMIEADKQAYQKAYDDMVLKYGGEEQTKEVLGKVNNFIEKTVAKNYPEFMDFIRETKVNTPSGETVLANHPVFAEAFRVMSEMISDDSRNIKGIETVTSQSLEEELGLLSVELANMADEYSPEYIAKKKRLNLIAQKLSA